MASCSVGNSRPKQLSGDHWLRLADGVPQHQWQDCKLLPIAHATTSHEECLLALPHHLSAVGSDVMAPASPHSCNASEMRYPDKGWDLQVLASKSSLSWVSHSR